jgi:electron transfer flavoprotein alpha subunit
VASDKEKRAVESALTRIVDFRCEDSLRRALAATASSAAPVRPPLTPPGGAVVERAPYRVLVVAEIIDGQFDLGTAKAVSCARRIGGELEVALFAPAGSALATIAAKMDGVTEVLQAPAVSDPDTLAQRVAALIRARHATHVLAPATAFGERLMARLSQLFNLPALLNVMRVVNPTTFARVRGRATVVTAETTSRPVLATVRLGAFHAAGVPRYRPLKEDPSS